MKGIRFIVFLFVFSSAFTVIHAQSYLEFVENKGQWDKQVSFRGLMVSGAFILKPDGGYRMVLHDHNDLSALSHYYHGESNNGGASTGLTTASHSITDNKTITLHSHAYEVKFLNANPNPVIIPDKPLNTYNNYYIGDDPSKWSSGCKIYTAVTYKNVYPNIDVRYYTSKGQLKYDIIVNPGGDTKNIALYFDGVDALKLRDGVLSVKTSVDEVKELPPYSYVQAEEGRQEMTSAYELKGNILRFNIGS